MWPRRLLLPRGGKDKGQGKFKDKSLGKGLRKVIKYFGKGFAKGKSKGYGTGFRDGFLYRGEFDFLEAEALLRNVEWLQADVLK